MTRLTADVAGDGVPGADVIIEAIFENADAKHELFARVEPRMKASAILASNTSSIMLEQLDDQLPDPGRLVGLHFFNPVSQLPLVEIVRGEIEQRGIHPEGHRLHAQIDKLPLPCKSAPGFLVNRVLVPYLYEAMFALQDGIPIEVIDEAALRFGMPMGPVELADVVGLDVCKHVGDIVSARAEQAETRHVAHRRADRRQETRSQERRRFLRVARRQGREVRRARVAEPPADLEDRLILALANECAAVLREGIVTDADLVDAGVIFGSGFAPFRGGPLTYARKRGIDAVIARLTELARAYGPRFTPDKGWSQLRTSALSTPPGVLAFRACDDAREVSVELLRSLTPLEGMKRENLHALAKKVTVKQLTAGRMLFKEGDADKRTIWIIQGLVELSEHGRTVGMIEGGSADARAPLNQSVPRKITARAVEDVDYLAIDADLLDVMITWDQTGNYEVGELQAQFGGGNDDSDWMTTLLQTKAFHRIPPANLQAIFMRMNRQPYRAGEVVIKQGDEGDFFYAIVQGRCLVTRESPLNQKGIKLAELGVGETFGEEALIAEAKRNATVTMLSDGVLMRLNKQDFRDLMHEPLLRWVDEAQALKIIQNRGQWLDVRLPSEYQNLAIEGSINIPLYFVRLKLNAIDRNMPYVVVCDTGRRSLRRGVHPFGARLRRLRAERRHHDFESADATPRLKWDVPISAKDPRLRVTRNSDSRIAPLLLSASTGRSAGPRRCKSTQEQTSSVVRRCTGEQPEARAPSGRFQSGESPPCGSCGEVSPCRARSKWRSRQFERLLAHSQEVVLHDLQLVHQG